MKLFGSKHGGAYASSKKRTGNSAAREGRRGEASASRRKHRLSGVQRGAILLLCSILVLAGTCVAIYRDFVKPVEIKQPSLPTVSDGVDGEEEVFTPPTTVEIETTVDEETGEEIELEVEVPASHKEGFYNILIAGTDDDGGRTDTIMIARLDTNDHTVALMSVPRDTLISGNYSVPKINSVYGGAGGGKDGMEALKSKLAQMLGFEVDGYVLVKLDVFIQLVDLVGGVEFDVPQRMYYSDPTQDLYIDLQPGLQTLNGEQAMGLVRFRKGYATQDIMRTQVQQQFLQALAKKYLSATTLTKLPELANLFFENVTTDMTVGNMVYYGQELLKCDFDNMFTYTLEGEAVMVSGASCYAIYQNKTLEVINEYFNPYDAEITAANVSIRTPESVYASSSSSSGSSSTTTEPDDTGETDPDTTDPGVTDPDATDPDATDPDVDDPGATDPDAGDPVEEDPGIPDDPLAGDPLAPSDETEWP